MQCRSLFLLIAALFFLGSRVAAQSTADQNLKTVPQQIKSNAENKASTKATAIGNSASDKVDSGMSKAYKGFVGMFKKKKKNKDSVVVVPPSAPPAVVSAPPVTADTTKKKN
jgi:hypothetical protein